MSRPELITFDLDDTLWPIGPVIQRAEETLHAWFADHHPRVAARWTPADLRGLRDAAPAEHPEHAHDLTALRKLSLRKAIVMAGADPDLTEEAFAVFWAARNAVEFHADALPALDALAGRYRLAAITNGNAEVARMPIARHFEFTLTAAGVGHAKPAPEIFHLACTRAGVAPAAVLHVGDDPHFDVAGALGAGLRSVWLNRSGQAWPHRHYRPHHEVADLLALVALLG